MQPVISKRLQAVLLLLTASMIWGTAFVAQRVAAGSVGTLTFNGVRFLLGALVLAPMLVANYRRGRLAIAGRKVALSGILLVGGLLTGGAALQQMGLQYTTAANAGFITSLYVVLIPIILTIGFGKKMPWGVWVASGTAVVGLYLLSAAGSLELNPGDVFELAGAGVWAFHVIVIAYFVKRMDTLLLSAGQFLVCGVTSLLAGLVLEAGAWQSLAGSVGIILYTGVLSVGVGYTLQIMGQKWAPPSAAAIIMSTEAVFAALFGWLLLGETLSLPQLIGCGLILAAVILAQITGTDPL